MRLFSVKITPKTTCSILANSRQNLSLKSVSNFTLTNFSIQEKIVYKMKIHSCKMNLQNKTQRTALNALQNTNCKSFTFLYLKFFKSKSLENAITRAVL